MKWLLIVALLSFAGVQGLQRWQPDMFGSTEQVLDSVAPVQSAMAEPEDELAVIVGSQDVLSPYVPLRVENHSRHLVRNAEVNCAAHFWFVDHQLYREMVPRIQGPGFARLNMPSDALMPRMQCAAHPSDS